MSAIKQFFDETTEQSTIKAKIVSKYLWAWADEMPLPPASNGELQGTLYCHIYSLAHRALAGRPFSLLASNVAHTFPHVSRFQPVG